MKNKLYKVLVSKKEYALLTIEAESLVEAINKAHNDDFIEVVYDEEKMPDSKYVIEEITEERL